MSGDHQHRGEGLNQHHFLSDVELAARWGMSAKTLRNLRVTGAHVPFVRLGRLVRYRLSDVLAWEEAHTLTSTSQTRGQQ